MYLTFHRQHSFTCVEDTIEEALAGSGGVEGSRGCLILIVRGAEHRVLELLSEEGLKVNLQKQTLELSNNKHYNNRCSATRWEA